MFSNLYYYIALYDITGNARQWEVKPKDHQCSMVEIEQTTNLLMDPNWQPPNNVGNEVTQQYNCTGSASAKSQALLAMWYA